MIVPGIIYEVGVGSITVVFLWIIAFPARTAYTNIKEAWTKAMEHLDSLQAELANQRQNHLSHIQASGERQVELLEKTVDSLQEIHLGQVEMSGYLKGKNR